MIKNLFTGRLARLQFLTGNIIVNFSFFLFLNYYFSNFRYDLWVVLWILFAVAVFFSFSFIVRRLHDIGSSGRWSVIFLLPFINIIFIIFLLLIPGKEEENRYGKRKKKIISALLGI